MKRLVASSFVVCGLLVLGAAGSTGVAATVWYNAVAPAPVATTIRHTAVARARIVAAVRHIPINHSPAPPLQTIEISTDHPAPMVAPHTSATACAGTPPGDQISSATCDPKNQQLRVEVVRLPAP